MIKSTDLRIGNKVKVFGKIYTIKELGEFEAAVEETHGVFVYSDVQGVELTPELLIGCGFDVDEEDPQIFNYKTVYLYYSLKGGTFNLYRSDDSITFSVCLCDNIKYLHQLQNFIFVYGGTELPINLEQVKV